MTTIALTLVVLPLALLIYAYLGYPLILVLAGRRSHSRFPAGDPPEWPRITIVVPAYNARGAIARTLDHLLAIDYPAERRQVIVVSDGSTDGTDDIVTAYADRGVELHRTPTRGGKTAAENAVVPLIRGEIVVNTDATVVVPPASVARLVRPFADPCIGVVSGRDVSVGREPRDRTIGEAGYSSYEMTVRSLEARFERIVGATGSLYALRRDLFVVPLPAEVSRDFASALLATERGWKSIADNEAVCIVGRAPTLIAEYRRKARTMVLGLDTLWYFRRMLDPRRFGWFSVMLASHKICRWLVYLLLPFAVLGVAALAPQSRVAAGVLAIGGIAAALGALAIWWPASRRLPPLLAFFGYATATTTAGVVAWTRFFRGVHSVVWEPTSRAG